MKDDNGLEAWRKLVRKFDPQNVEVYAAQLEHIVTSGTRNVVKSLGDVPTILKRYRACRRPAFLLLYIFIHVGVGSRQSEIGDRKLESWTLGNVEDSVLFQPFF